jgi:autophagy-related protein 2
LVIFCFLQGLGETARNFVAVASAEHVEKGVYGAVGGVLRQILPTVVTPVLLASEATACVLGGLRSQLAPDAHDEKLSSSGGAASRNDKI